MALSEVSSLWNVGTDTRATSIVTAIDFVVAVLPYPSLAEIPIVADVAVGVEKVSS